MSRIGLLSDSHGRADTTRMAVELLLDKGAEQLIHLGDVGSIAVLDVLVATRSGTTIPVPVAVVFGNVDYDWKDLSRHAQAIGVTVGHPVGRLNLDEGELIYTHGDSTTDLHKALRQGVRYVCHGHTHLSRDTRVGATRVINPGALYRATEYTVAILDDRIDQVEFYRVASR